MGKRYFGDSNFGFFLKDKHGRTCVDLFCNYTLDVDFDTGEVTETWKGDDVDRDGKPGGRVNIYEDNPMEIAHKVGLDKPAYETLITDPITREAEVWSSPSPDGDGVVPSGSGDTEEADDEWSEAKKTAFFKNMSDIEKKSFALLEKLKKEHEEKKARQKMYLYAGGAIGGTALLYILYKQLGSK